MISEEFVAERIEQLLAEKNMSRYRLGQYSDLNDTTLYNIMKRKTIPSIITLSKICDGFGITLAQFFYDSENNMEYTKEERNLLSSFSRLSAYDRGVVLLMIDILGKRKNEKKE